jgi:protein SHQ1
LATNTTSSGGGSTISKPQKSLIEDLSDMNLNCDDDSQQKDSGKSSRHQDKDTGVVDFTGTRNYGFLRMYSGYFRGLYEMGLLLEMVELDPEKLWLQSLDDSEEEDQGDDWRQNREATMAYIDDRFDPEAYIADYIAQHEDIDPLIAWKAWWNGSDKSDKPIVDIRSLTEEEHIFLTEQLPRRSYEFPTEKDWRRHSYLLISLLYAYAYDYRTNTGDTTPESAWTMVKLSPVLARFRLPPIDLEGLLTETLYRTATFPLYRNRQLFAKCCQDVCDIMHLGRVAVLKALLGVAHTLSHHEEAWRLGKVWVNDSCSWLQMDDRLDDDGLAELSSQLMTATRQLLNREDLAIGEWPLDLLEASDCSSSTVSPSEYDDQSISEISVDSRDEYSDDSIKM